jgi:type III secretory pathway component EscV
MILKKLEELGYKPKKDIQKEKPINETSDILKNIRSSEVKQEILNLLLEALSETNPKEILVYGMYVKKTLSPIIRTKQKNHIEKTMELLKEALGKK